MRLSVYLANSGVCSRRAAEVWVKNRRVKINGQPVTDITRAVDPSNDNVEIKTDENWREIKPVAEKTVYALYKPAGFDSTRGDPHAKNTVLDLIKVPERIYPVGRLDRQTKGLILLTNDGQLANHLTKPDHQINKTYLVDCTIPYNYDQRQLKNNLKKLENGVIIDDRRTAPAKIKVLEQTDHHLQIEIKIHEGRNRQIRRMIQKIGLEVADLTRTSIGKLNLKDLGLKPGQYIKLGSEKLRQLE